MTTVLLDTHVIFWLSSDPTKLSDKAVKEIKSADEIVVSSITWFELAWLVKNDRIRISIPMNTWLTQLSHGLGTIEVSPEIASCAVNLSPRFPSDPADRIIFATAIETGYPLITKDKEIRQFKHPSNLAIW